jgi:hypothetical protein
MSNLAQANNNYFGFQYPSTSSMFQMASTASPSTPSLLPMATSGSQSNVWNMPAPTTTAQPATQAVPTGPSVFGFNSISEKDTQSLVERISAIYNGPDAVDMEFKTNANGSKTTVTINKADDPDRQCAVERGETDSKGYKLTIPLEDRLTYNKIVQSLTNQKQPVTINYKKTDEDTVEISFCTRRSHKEAITRGMSKTSCQPGEPDAGCSETDDEMATEIGPDASDETAADIDPQEDSSHQPNGCSSCSGADESSIPSGRAGSASEGRYVPLDEFENPSVESGKKKP